MVENYKHSGITGEIIKAFFVVYNRLGYGFLEKVYENALLLELRKKELKCVSQQPVDVYYDSEIIGSYVADIVVEDVVIVELKAVEALREEHEAQLTNYLRATQIEVGLLLNFGKEPLFKRKVFSNRFKS